MVLNYVAESEVLWVDGKMLSDTNQFTEHLVRTHRENIIRATRIATRKC